MKILIVAGSYAPEKGGIAELVQGLAAGLNENEVDVYILTPIRGAAYFSTPRVKITEFDLPEHGYLRRVWACRRAVLGLASRVPFDRVIASSWSPYGVAVPSSAAGKKLRLDILCHGTDLLDPQRSAPYRLLMRHTLRRATEIVANSHFTADLARSAGGPSDRIRVIHPGVDPDRFLPGPRNHHVLTRCRVFRDAPVLLTVGRLVERKGFDLVLRALPALREQFSTIAYLIVGDGPARAQLETQVKALGLSDHVHFAGSPSDEELPGFYHSADVFVMPNRFLAETGDVEGFGIVFLEAACCELPVVGGRSGGTADAILEGKNGYLVDPHDPEGLSAVLASLLSDQDLRCRLGRAGRVRAIEKFRWPLIARKYLGCPQ